MTKKFINNCDEIVEDMIEGFCKAHSETIFKAENSNLVIYKHRNKSKVGVIIGNGSGHEPACIGFVGSNMLDCNAYGGLFASPGPYTILDAIKVADNGQGVCVLISNHAGDVLNSKMAIDMAEDDGYVAKGVVLYDDVASASKYEDPTERRGTAGTLFAYKMVGSYANEGHSLEKVCDFAAKVRDNTRTISVASVPGTSPITFKPMFDIAQDEFEIGMGVHGEAAAKTMKVCTSKELAKQMSDMLLIDKPYVAGDEISVLVNGMGQTTYMELCIFYNDVESYLRENGIKIHKPLIGSFITSQEMGGIALSFCKLDEEMKTMWGKPTDAVGFPSL